MESQKDKIDLSKIDWNSLTVEDFFELEEKIKKRDSVLKEAKVRKERISPNKMVNVKIKDDVYTIPLVLYNRLKELNSEKSKQKVIDEIKSSYSPIPQI